MRTGAASGPSRASTSRSRIAGQREAISQRLCGRSISPESEDGRARMDHAVRHRAPQRRGEFSHGLAHRRVVSVARHRAGRAEDDIALEVDQRSRQRLADNVDDRAADGAGISDQHAGRATPAPSAAGRFRQQPAGQEFTDRARDGRGPQARQAADLGARLGPALCDDPVDQGAVALLCRGGRRVRRRLGA